MKTFFEIIRCFLIGLVPVTLGSIVILGIIFLIVRVGQFLASIPSGKTFVDVVLLFIGILAVGLIARLIYDTGKDISKK